jgi:insertion element IS1 protein InsB
MCYEVITCPSCSSQNIKKNGWTANQKQPYLRQFLTDDTELGSGAALRQLVVLLRLNGCGIRDIERVLLISQTTILKRLRLEATAVPEPSVPGRVETLELDEFWSFVGTKKRQPWTRYGFDRRRKKAVAFVNGPRTKQSCRRLRDKLRGCRIRHYRSDGWPSYRNFLPRMQHEASKAGRLNIERNHLNFRTRIKRLQRRTICFSKSAEMHETVIKLYVHYSNSP